jgi:hypothetical protein
MAIKAPPESDLQEVAQGKGSGVPPKPGSFLRHRALWGYGPLLAFVVVFTLMATLLPSVVRQAPEVEVAETAAEQAERLGLTDAPTEGRAAIEGVAGTDPSTVTVPPEVTHIEGQLQIPGDPYSPPRIEFEGDNGGATWRGVTEDEIIVSVRVLNERGFAQTLAQLAGAEIVDTPPDVTRTFQAFEQYVNERFQFYGRQLRLVFYEGRGSTTDELLGRGRAEAGADALHVADDIGAFAELNGASEPFVGALAQEGVVAWGTPYLSRTWHAERRPYAWGFFPDCDVVAEAAAEIYAKQMAGKPAEFAGPGLHGNMRRVAGISPENPWYQVCHDSAIRIIEEAGHDPGIKVNYTLDLGRFSQLAASRVAILKNEGITTILCGCDPIFPVFLTAKAAEQNYNPEWIVLGTAGTDLDIVGQLYNQNQWSRTFGVSFLGEQVPQRAGLGYSAYKTVRDDEPAFTNEGIYATMYMFAIGVQMAGPNLTPETFEQGLFSYQQPRAGPFGTWGWNPDSRGGPTDTRIIWWNPDKISIFNGKRGAYEEAYGGQRFGPGEIPTGDPQVFGR